MMQAGCNHFSDSEQRYHDSIGVLCERCQRAQMTAWRAELAEATRERDEARRAAWNSAEKRDLAEQDAARLADACQAVEDGKPTVEGFRTEWDQVRAALAAHEERVGGER